MKYLACLMTLFVSACASVPTDNAICSVTEEPRTDLAGALVDDGGPRSQRAGLVLIETLDVSCPR
ncbi:hypothetical protein CP157_01162 [Paracoccus marcusii]|nr:hypothetical protein CP157_01162 [Paracoccus marcusii]